MESAFSSGDQEQGDNARQQMAAANFDAARFSRPLTQLTGLAAVASSGE